jgi:hypothetical protein
MGRDLVPPKLIAMYQSRPLIKVQMFQSLQLHCVELRALDHRQVVSPLAERQELRTEPMVREGKLLL